MSINRWMDKEDVVHIYNGILLSHKNEWNITICSNMDGPRDDPTKQNKSDKEWQISLYHLYVESKLWHKWTYLWNTDLENRLVVAKARGGEGNNWEFGISRCKLVCIGWINNKVLLYSTGNYIQYPVIDHNGKEYIYIKRNHFAVQQKLNTTL